MRDHGDDDAEFANKVFQKAHDDSGWSPLRADAKITFLLQSFLDH